MNGIFWEVAIVLVLTLLNGFFVCCEIALISVRKTFVANLVKQGNPRAKVIQELQSDPERLFATVQVGMSTITILTSAFAGSSIAASLGEYLQRFPLLAPHAYVLSFAVVVILVTYISLIIGELVPKSLGLRYAQKFALFAAYPIFALSKVSRWVVVFLSFSANLILRPFKDSTSFTESRLSEEEIRTLISEGKKDGTIEAHEHNMIENVFELSDLTVGKVMVPRPQITAFDANEPVEQIIRKAVDSGYSRIPIYKGKFNNVIGILYTKKLLHSLGKDIKDLNLEQFLLAPYFIPSVMKIGEVLRRLQKRKIHMALVTNEHGEVEGLVTLEDLLEEIVGEIADETDEANKSILKQADGSYLVSGEVPVLDFNSYFASKVSEDEDFSTVSGFLLDKLGRFPEQGEKVLHDDLEFVIQEKSERTILRVVVRRNERLSESI